MACDGSLTWPGAKRLADVTAPFAITPVVDAGTVLGGVANSAQGAKLARVAAAAGPRMKANLQGQANGWAAFGNALQMMGYVGVLHDIEQYAVDNRCQGH